MRLIHGEHDTRLYTIWRGMKSRCQTPSSSGYENYGARDIKVCQEWQTYEPFRDWAVSNGYADHLEIDREDNEGNYEPSNCQWTTRKVNTRNRRDNFIITAFGESKSMCEWLEDPRCVTNRSALRNRLLTIGMSAEEAITKPLAIRNILYSAFNEEKTLDGWVVDSRCTVSRSQLHRRFKSDMPTEEAITKLSRNRRK